MLGAGVAQCQMKMREVQMASLETLWRLCSSRDMLPRLTASSRAFAPAATGTTACLLHQRGLSEGVCSRDDAGTTE